MLTKRVGMLVHSYYPIDARVRREAEALVGVGYDVEVICLRRTGLNGEGGEPPTEIVNGVRVHRLPLERKRASQLRYFFEPSALNPLT